jgi:hypothetical protein
MPSSSALCHSKRLFRSSATLCSWNLSVVVFGPGLRSCLEHTSSDTHPCMLVSAPRVVSSALAVTIDGGLLFVCVHTCSQSIYGRSRVVQ